MNNQLKLFRKLSCKQPPLFGRGLGKAGGSISDSYVVCHRAAEEVRRVGSRRQELHGQGELGQQGQVAAAEERVGQRGRAQRASRGNSRYPSKES